MRRHNRALFFLAAAGLVLAACQPARPPTLTPTPTDSAANTVTPAFTYTITATVTFAPTHTSTATPTNTETPTKTATSTETPAATETPTPTSVRAETATPTPRPAPTQVPSVRLSLPAGASAALQFAASALLANANPLTWRVSGLPAAIDTKTIPGPIPGSGAVWLQTDCAQPAGSYAGALEATVAETFVITRISLTVAGLVEPVKGGTRLVSMANPEDAYALRRGGPSTLKNGPGIPLTFCRAQAGRALTAFVSEAKTISGLPLSPFPALSMLRVYGWPSPRAVQTTGIGANAVDIAFEDSGRIDWTVAPGNYILVAEASPLIPVERRPYTITLILELR